MHKHRVKVRLNNVTNIMNVVAKMRSDYNLEFLHEFSYAKHCFPKSLHTAKYITDLDIAREYMNKDETLYVNKSDDSQIQSITFHRSAVQRRRWLIP